MIPIFASSFWVWWLAYCFGNATFLDDLVFGFSFPFISLNATTVWFPNKQTKQWLPTATAFLLFMGFLLFSKCSDYGQHDVPKRTCCLVFACCLRLVGSWSFIYCTVLYLHIICESRYASAAQKRTRCPM